MKWRVCRCPVTVVVAAANVEYWMTVEALVVETVAEQVALADAPYEEKTLIN
jgi:hypothetical protein